MSEAAQKRKTAEKVPTSADIKRGPWTGKTRATGGKFYEFTYTCPQCEMVLKILDYWYGEKICGTCNCKLFMNKVAKQ